MNYKPLFIFITAFSFLSVGLPKNIQKKVDKAIIETFQTETFSLNIVTITPEVLKILPSNFGSDNLFEITNSSTLLGYAYVSKAPSKTDDFDYLVLLGPELIVLKAKILIYREDYGGEIGSKRWLKQFIGKTPNNELRYQDNIMAISGATISVRSMTNAMNEFLKAVKTLQSKNIL